MEFETRAIHEGQEFDPETGAVITPVYQTSTYRQEKIGVHKGYEYSRTGNPTRNALEKSLANLEGGTYGLAFASGVAATTAVFNLLKTGDHVIVGDDCYGGTYRLLEKVFARWGLETSYVQVDDPQAFAAAVRGNTKLIWVETPTNPLLKLTDLKALADIAKSKKLLLAVDNTFASPYFQKPLQLGADIVVHSTTKYLNGHSDGVGGAVILNDAAMAERLKFIQNAAGAILGPFDCWLVLRGVKTLAIRMERHNQNGMAIAQFLDRHRKVKQVFYPGLPSHPQHDLARKQMSGFGGMLAFETGSLDKAKVVLKSFRLCSLAESLGGVETLISHPATMTHTSVPPEERQRIGITDGLVRISVGIENVEDLIADLDQALARV